MVAEQERVAGAEVPHVRIVMGMVIGLGVARLLYGVARIVQHPKCYRLYPVRRHGPCACSLPSHDVEAA